MNTNNHNTEAYARELDPGTSHEAAGSVRATKLEACVLTAIRNCGERGATSYELEKITSLPNQTLTPRFAPLCRKHKIHDSGEKRIGGSGRRQIVWKYIGEEENHETF